MSAPSSTTSGVHFRMDFNLGSNRSEPPGTAKKRPRRPVRKIQTRVRPRGPFSNYEPVSIPFTEVRRHQRPADQPAQAPQIVLAAADTDTKSESLSDEVKAMQDEARTTIYENFSQQVDHESLKILEEANKANDDFAKDLDDLSLAIVKAATEKPEFFEDDLDGETVTNSDEDDYCNCLRCRLNDQPIYFTLGRAGRSADGTESFSIVDSTPSLNSDDVFGAAIPRSMPAPQMQLAMPVLTLSDASSDNTASTGRPLGPIEEDSTSSSRAPSPPVNTPAEFVPSMSASTVLAGCLAARLEEISKKQSEVARSQALLEVDVGKNAKEAFSQSWLEDQIAEAMSAEVEALDDDDEVLDDEDEEDWVVINEEDVAGN